MRNRILNSAAALALTTGFALPALAQDVVVETQGANELRADWIVGASIRSTQGETIGSIQELILDTETGGITAAVVGVGGFLGFGGKSIAVDWSELQIDWDGDEITLDLTREQAEDAPEYAYREREYPPPATPEATGAPAGTGTMGGGLQ